jgi:hypothetical protein
MPRIWKLLVAGVALVLGLPLSASAAQLDADERPTTSGPVATSSELKSCRSKRVKTGNRTVARVRVCSRYFLFNPDAETDPANDYGAYWIQLNANAIRGFCVKAIRTDLSYGNGVHAKAPKPATTVKAGKKRRLTTKLAVDAQGNSDDTGIIKNSFVLHPGTMTARVRDGDTYRLRWRGSSGGKLAFAAGLELSWATNQDAPDIDPQIVLRLSRAC